MSKEENEVKEPAEIDVEEESEDKLEETVEETVQVENPQESLRKKCRPECQKHVAKLDECTDRVLSRSETKEICFEELTDLLNCVDHCVAHDLFKYLK